MAQNVTLRGKKADGSEKSILVDDNGKLETTATLTGDITIGEVEVSNFPATQTVNGAVTVTSGDVDVGTVTTVAAVTDITNKVSIDTVDSITDITNKVDVVQVDDYGFEAELTPQGEQRTVEPVRLSGTAFNGTTLDTNFWTATTGTGGSVTQAGGLVTLSTGTTADNTVTLQSSRPGIFVPGSSNRFRGQILAGTGTANCVKRWGAFSTTDGFFFELSGTSLRIVIRKASGDTVVAQAAWNQSTSFTLDANIHTFEIYWTGKNAYFIIDDELKHVATATTSGLVETTTLPVRSEIFNTNGSTTDVSLKANTMAIHRLGKLETAPMSKYISGAVTGVFKYNPGRLQRIIFTPGSNGNTLLLYDAVTATNTMIKIGGSNTAGVTVAFEVGAQFYTGLYYAMTGANSTATVIYE